MDTPLMISAMLFIAAIGLIFHHGTIPQGSVGVVTESRIFPGLALASSLKHLRTISIDASRQPVLPIDGINHRYDQQR